MPPTRRNLFQSHLSRRPASNPPQSSTTEANNTPTDNHNDDHDNHETQNSSHQSSFMTPETRPMATTTTAQPNNGDIIARDKNGKFQLDVPVLPPIPLDESDEEDDVEGEDEGAMEGIEEDGRPSVGSESMGKDKDSEFIPSFPLEPVGLSWLIGGKELEADLVEMMYRNRNRHLSGEPELLNLLQQSLRSKVATLEEDNWMFETEDDPLV